MEDRERKEVRIAELQAEVAAAELEISHHRQRLQQAREYRYYLVLQKMAETGPEDAVADFKTLAAGMSSQKPEEARAQARALRLVELMEGRDEVDMAAGDTDSEEGGEGDERGGSSRDAESERTRLDLADGAGAELENDDQHEELRRQLGDAQRRLEEVRLERSEALSKVDGPTGGGSKRSSDGEAKEGDGVGDIEMVPPLTGLQVDAMYAGRLREAEERVRHLRILLAKEAVQPPAPAAVAAAASGSAEAAPAPPAPDRPGQQADGRAAVALQKEGANEGHQRGRPRRRAGYESWVTAEQNDEEQRKRQQHEEAQPSRIPPRRPRTASRDNGPGRCRWTAGERAQPAAAAAAAASGTLVRQRSAGAGHGRKGGWMEVELEYRRQQRAADDVEGRVRDNLQVAQQERMQQVQEAERRETAMGKVRAAASEVEARLAGPPLEGQAVRRQSPGPRRRRWGDDSDTEDEGGRERSQRRARGGRHIGGAMEDEVVVRPSGAAAEWYPGRPGDSPGSSRGRARAVGREDGLHQEPRPPVEGKASGAQ